MKQCGIQHIRTSPYHPSSNGFAECAVQTFKSSLKKLEGNVKTCLFTFLARYRVTPHSTTELSLAELLMGMKLRTTLDLMHPDVSRKVTTKLTSRSSREPPRTFSVGDKVIAHNYHGRKMWLPAEIVQVAGPVSYKVKTSSNLILRCRVDQLHTRYGHSMKILLLIMIWIIGLFHHLSIVLVIHLLLQLLYLPTLHLLNLSQYVVPLESVELLTDMVHTFLS